MNTYKHQVRYNTRSEKAKAENILASYSSLCCRQLRMHLMYPTTSVFSKKINNQLKYFGGHGHLLLDDLVGEILFLYHTQIITSSACVIELSHRNQK